jgi:hypothetical protein
MLNTFNLDKLKSFIHTLTERDVYKAMVNITTEIYGRQNEVFFIKSFEIIPANPICNHCYKQCKMVCTKCRRRYFCDKKCQKENWLSHKKFCKSKRIFNNPEQIRILQKSIQKRKIVPLIKIVLESRYRLHDDEIYEIITNGWDNDSQLLNGWIAIDDCPFQPIIKYPINYNFEIVPYECPQENDNSTVDIHSELTVKIWASRIPTWIDIYLAETSYPWSR